MVAGRLSLPAATFTRRIEREGGKEVESETVGSFSIRETYESLIEYANVSQARGRNRHSRNGNAKPKHFNGYTSFSDALNMARKGWDVEAGQALNLAEQAELTLREERLIPTPTQMWDVSGAEVDVPRFLGNEPECMLEFPPAERLRVGDTVTIVRQFTVSGRTDAEDIKKYGRLIAALVLAIEAMGLSAEVWAEGVITTWGAVRGRVYQRVKVKGAGDMLHAGQLMFALAHPAMLRQVTFGSLDCKEWPDELYESTGPNYGRGSPGERNEDEKALYPEGALFFDASEWNQDPVIFLVEQLRKLNLIPERI